MKILDKRMAEFETESDMHKQNLKLDQEKLNAGLKSLQKRVGLLEDKFDINKASSIAAEVRLIRKTLNTYQEDIQLLNKQETLFGQDLTEYPEAEHISDVLLPYELFWLNTAEFHKYRKLEYLDQLSLEPAHLIESVMGFRRNLELSLEYITPENNSKLNEAVGRVIGEIDEFLKSKRE